MRRLLAALAATAMLGLSFAHGDETEQPYVIRGLGSTMLSMPSPQGPHVILFHNKHECEEVLASDQFKEVSEDWTADMRAALRCEPAHLPEPGHEI